MTDDPGREPEHRYAYRYTGGSARRDPVLAGIVRRFADAVARLRGRFTGTKWTDETKFWDDDADDGGWAAAGVPLRPPDKSGSGSVALTEPDDPDDAQT